MRTTTRSTTLFLENEIEGPLEDVAVIAKVLPILVNAGMTRANARRWIINNLLGGYANTAGAFEGGVS